MARPNRQVKEESFNFRVPSDLKVAFQKAAEIADRPAAQVIRDFMRAYIKEHQKPEAGYDAWLKAQVQAALDDPSPTQPYNVVLEKARSIIDQINKKDSD